MSDQAKATSVITADLKNELKGGFEVQGALNGGMIVFSSRYGSRGDMPSRILGSFSTPQDMLDWLTLGLTEEPHG